ncbi:glycoside hydrolase family 13 protein [Butyrivibrio sp. WCD3002]|uniref:glycoside hydrolase family 13 protein n=1 Tax=Butyrivibrio sp. WCD3002 TaxID=1280676 RepID=UPI000420A708|nr:alpha-glucosidase [Butyrivibrio sp. WCD3002]
MDKKWWKNAVVYQIYPRSFKDSNGDGIGDLKGITEKLDYLKNLGVTIIWLSPIYKSPNKDNGYDISDYRDIMAEFGTMADFDEMLSEAHKRGLKIVMDLVVNHSSDQHKWFLESKKSKDNPYRDYYIWKDPVDGHEPTNWGAFFSGSAWQFDETTGQYYLHQFVPEQPDLNWENPKVRDGVFDMMNWWCEKGIDGFRMDVISLISKPEVYEDGPVRPGEKYAFCGNITANGPHVHEYLKEMNQKVLSKYDLVTVGEAAGVTIEEAKKYAGFDSKELNMVFQFEHMDLDSDEHGKWTMKKLYLPDLKVNLTKWQKELAGVAWNSLFWDNHDQPRIVSRWGNDSDEYREISAKMLATCLHMMQGTPYVYQGEEFGMTNYTFKEISDCDDVEEINIYKDLVTDAKVYTHEEMMNVISAKGRDNARTPMQWDDSENGGFTTGKPWLKVNPNYKTINAAAEVDDPDSVYNYYKKLIGLRKENDIIVDGTYELLEAEDENLFIYTRSLNGRKLLVVCNFTDKTLDVPKSIEAMTGGDILISNYKEKASSIRPYEATVFDLKD